jgi:hypothetical protein
VIGLGNSLIGCKIGPEWLDCGEMFSTIYFLFIGIASAIAMPRITDGWSNANVPCSYASGDSILH